ncbi:glutathione-dependent reductase [Halocalculus aciditolerans]|uniref:Glutathione-dependent reductase n=2 Tax=Halocalculus aciditolerans TaxID=1383812 RepID=A0A830F6U0_9EURY|nr:glutathione-dependent reductase [Halocalculus aciditolerans]
MIDGEWHTDAEQLSKSERGEFQRDQTSFRDWIRGTRRGPDDVVEDGPEPEAGRYHLYVSYACPWAHRVLLTRALKGLEDAIDVSVVDPVRVDQGWEFDAEKPGTTPDKLFGSDYLREVYARADPDYTGRVTVPVLYDTAEDAIVNNESAEIMRMLDTAFDDYAENDVDLYPEGYREEVDDLIERIYDPINNGVYKAGFAGTQDAYEDAVTDLFDALTEWDATLGTQRFLAGDRLTEADLAMFTTLYRFDEVYHTHFKCNHREITDYDHLWGYLRDLCNLPGVEATCDMHHVKEHYYRSHTDLNPKGIVPIGPDPDFFAPHTRDDLPGDLPDALRTP